MVELIVVMAIFMTILMITASAFNTIVNSSSQQSKSVETQIEGIVGLEVLRADLEHAGFGLPWVFQAAPATTLYLEAVAISSAPGITADTFNDAPDKPPRAIQSSETTFNKDSNGIGSKYLVIKSMVAATNATSKKWTNVSFANGTKIPPTIWGTTERDFVGTDHVIVVKNSLNSTPPTRQLMVTGTWSAPAATAGIFSTTYSNYSSLTQPHLDGDTFQIYGVDPDSDLRMPFNRTDYYVKTPAKMPSTCAPNTGVLYKAVINQGPSTNPSAGKFLEMPLLDCVADMQVVYGLDNDGTGRVNQHFTAPANTSPVTAADIKNQLREIRVYILAQEGRKDLMYSYPSPTIEVGESFDGGSTVAGRLFNLPALIGPDYKYYRWKVYTIVVRPKNLIQ